MATQKGSIILEGQIGNLSFYRSNGKPLARQRSGVSKERIAKDPRYVRTRENNTEFGRASSAARLIRLAARLSLGERHELFEDTTLVNRLTPRMAAIVRADDIHGRGERVVLPKSLSLLHGFSFNAVSALKDVLFTSPRYTYRRETGLLEVVLPALCPVSAIAAPKGGELCSFHVAALSFSTDYQLLPFVAQENELLPIGQQTIPSQTFRLELPEASADPMIICFGISFFRKQGGYPIPIIEQGRNVFEVIGVDTACSNDRDMQ
ncbi:hypothetical protein GCM10011386_08170 [Parapedobacter defluvii]|uniref:Uncharacterized protein n=1 Tax=Parapedobacter defluvii TaxID=2045106 RepID=A0ABQ1L5C9_9SPHI|nr:hypothetical protein [Parapedobacter defluvii]GGC18675.1 hypothetical protein GCM10011386_08170 [Parapedobacter defluvii]